MKSYYELEVAKRDELSVLSELHANKRQPHYYSRLALHRERYDALRLQQLGIEAEAKKLVYYAIRSQHAARHHTQGVRDALLGKYGQRPHTKVAAQAYDAGFKAGARWRTQNEG